MEKVFLFGCNNIRKEGFFFRMKDSRSRGSTVFLWTKQYFYSANIDSACLMLQDMHTERQHRYNILCF